MVTHLARKAFYPAKIPFPLLHIDTGHNFEETLTYRDEMVTRLGVRLKIASVQELIDTGELTEENGFNATRNYLQTPVLLKAIEDGKYDVALGGARRDEEKARAKERFFSHRDEFGQWDPKINVRNYGTFSMERNVPANILGFFPSVIGQNLMFGCIWP